MTPELRHVEFMPKQYGKTKLLNITRKTTPILFFDISPLKTPPHLPQATPKRFGICALLDDRLMLRMSIEVEIEKENDTYIAKCDALDEFGYGDDPMTSINDLQATLAELYWALKEEQNKLSSYLAKIWKRLQEIIIER